MVLCRGDTTKSGPTMLVLTPNINKILTLFSLSSLISMRHLAFFEKFRYLPHRKKSRNSIKSRSKDTGGNFTLVSWELRTERFVSHWKLLDDLIFPIPFHGSLEGYFFIFMEDTKYEGLFIFFFIPWKTPLEAKKFLKTSIKNYLIPQNITSIYNEI